MAINGKAQPGQGAGPDAHQWQILEHGHSSTSARLRLPPFGAELAERLRYANRPRWVFVFAGRNAWPRANALRASTQADVALIWTGGRHRWPVKGCACLVEADVGPSLEQLKALAAELLMAGADRVFLWSIHWRLAWPTVYFADGTGVRFDADDINAILRPERLRDAA